MGGGGGGRGRDESDAMDAAPAAVWRRLAQPGRGGRIRCVRWNRLQALRHQTPDTWSSVTLSSHSPTTFSKRAPPPLSGRLMSAGLGSNTLPCLPSLGPFPGPCPFPLLLCPPAGVALAGQTRALLLLENVVPDCRYCGLYHGNEQTHLGACVELYDRQCRTVVAVAEFMSRELDYSVLASWDTVVQLCKSEVVVWIAVEIDALFAVRKAALCGLPGQQVVVITVSGLLWVSQPSSRSPGYLSALVRQQLS